MPASVSRFLLIWLTPFILWDSAHSNTDLKAPLVTCQVLDRLATPLCFCHPRQAAGGRGLLSLCWSLFSLHGPELLSASLQRTSDIKSTLMCCHCEIAYGFPNILQATGVDAPWGRGWHTAAVSLKMDRESVGSRTRPPPTSCQSTLAALLLWAPGTGCDTRSLLCFPG